MDGWPDGKPDPGPARWPAIVAGLLLAGAALAIYGVTHVDRYYDHFVWQAAAFLEGHAAIRYPVDAGGGLSGNRYFQDVLPVVTTDGIARALLPFPPLPAVVLVPFVALWGLAADDQAIFTIIAAIDVALCWWTLGRLPIAPVVRLATTIFFAFGTVFWYTAQISTTWYQAHEMAVGLSFIAIGLALGAHGRPARPRLGAFAVDPRQFVVGLLFGLACTARLTVVFGAPFFAFVGAGSDWKRRSWSTGLGAALPILAFVLYNVVSTGQPVSPAYDHLYRLETAGYPMLGYHADWGIEDPRYLVGNLGIALFGTPDIAPVALTDALGMTTIPVCTDPAAARGLFDVGCPLAVPRDTGMSVLLTSPAYLLAIPALMRLRRSRVVAGAFIAVIGIATVNLMHFSQGWVQFGYRFSNDAAPFAMVLVALGFQRLVAQRRWGMLAAMTLVVLSLAINLWGVFWGRMLGW